MAPALPRTVADCARGRVLDDRTVADRARALDERLPHGLERQSEHGDRLGPGQAPRDPARGKRCRHVPRRGYPACSRRGPGRQLRRGRRHRALHRSRARSRVGTDVRPEPRRVRLRLDRGDHGAVQAGLTAPRPGDGRPLRPGLHVQDRHGLGCPRHRQVHPGERLRRPRLLHRVRPAGVQLLRPGDPAASAR